MLGCARGKGNREVGSTTGELSTNEECERNKKAGTRARRRPSPQSRTRGFLLVGSLRVISPTSSLQKSIQKLFSSRRWRDGREGVSLSPPLSVCCLWPSAIILIPALGRHNLSRSDFYLVCLMQWWWGYESRAAVMEEEVKPNVLRDEVIDLLSNGPPEV